MPNTPTYILYHGKATGKDKAGKKIWTRIGAVWPNKSGKGFNLTWDYLPLGDGLTVMLPFDKEGGEGCHHLRYSTSCVEQTRLKRRVCSITCTLNCTFQLISSPGQFLKLRFFPYLL